jgi:hypothetical protein
LPQCLQDHVTSLHVGAEGKKGTESPTTSARLVNRSPLGGWVSFSEFRRVQSSFSCSCFSWGTSINELKIMFCPRNKLTLQLRSMSNLSSDTTAHSTYNIGLIFALQVAYVVVPYGTLGSRNKLRLQLCSWLNFSYNCTYGVNLSIASCLCSCPLCYFTIYRIVVED